ncbi:ATP-binding protein [Pedobacter sp. SAFR-022]|uniref:ATP-binding protein n=1 Tax=Pedobacter sp. SAFR-022 TaxID=3436861 RepID=UPI003F812E87
MKEQDKKRLTERTLLDIIALSADAMAIYTGEEIIIEFANDAMLALWGKGREVIGLPLYEAVPALQGRPFKKMMQQVLKTGISDAGIAVIDTPKNGIVQTRYSEYEYRAIKDAAGNAYAILHRAANVTERELRNIRLLASEAEIQALNEELTTSNEELSTSNDELAQINKELQTSNVDIRRLNRELKEYTANLRQMYDSLVESEGRFRDLVQQAPVASFIVTGEQMMIETANHLMLTMLGKDKSILGKPIVEALPELKGQPFEGLLNQVYRTGETFYGNELSAHLEHDGQLVSGYYKFIYKPLKNPDGSSHSIICIALDITEQVSARKAAEQAEERLQLAVDATELGIWTVDWKTGKLTLSERSRLIHGLRSGDAITLSESFEMIDPKYRDYVRDHINLAVTEKRSFRVEHLLHPREGSSSRWLRSTGKATYDDAGEPILMTGTILDITEEKHNDQRKNDFISMVSHELKTPLTSMHGYLQVLQRNATRNADDSSKSLAGKAIRQVDRMMKLINSFLNVSRLENNQIHIERKCFDMAELIRESEEESMVQVSNHQFVFAAAERMMVKADRDKIGQVINNLISNAVKYSPQGSTIHIACRIQDGHAMVSVRDEGKGLAEADLSKIFERYYRVNNAESQTIAGFGIGLYLCFEIIKRHDGRIWAESSPGSGSTFYFTLPIDPEATS